MAAETRVVLVKPGDVLIFGNVGDVCDVNGGFDAINDAMTGLKDAVGLRHVVLFQEDIDLAAIPGDGA